jgi:hypothetical protein
VGPIGDLDIVLLQFGTQVLGEMKGWAFEWEPIQAILEQYQSSLAWLAITLVLIFVLGTQMVFFPFFYRGMKQQAPGSMRLAYLSSLLVAIIVFHWWLWQVLFVALLHNYWVWLAWGLIVLLWGGLVFWTPKRRLES